jgi:undecaprenyl-diphosphatase
VGRYPHFDNGIEFLSENDLKDSIFVAIFWWHWFKRADTATLRSTREHLLSTLCAGVVAVLAARILALTLPFRVRPRFEPALHFVVRAGNISDLVDWSAFPSDHAAMFSAFAVGMCFISWRTGLIAMLYTIFIICLPRIYLGLHYPSDIFAGLALGALVGYCMNADAVRRNWVRRPMEWERASPGGFYVVLFLVSYEFSTMFNGLRAAAAAAIHLRSY